MGSIHLPGVESSLYNLEEKYSEIKKTGRMEWRDHGGDTRRIDTLNGAHNVHDQMVLRGRRTGGIPQFLEPKRNPTIRGQETAWLDIVYSAVSS